MRGIAGVSFAPGGVLTVAAVGFIAGEEILLHGNEPVASGLFRHGTKYAVVRGGCTMESLRWGRLRALRKVCNGWEPSLFRPTMPPKVVKFHTS